MHRKVQKSGRLSGTGNQLPISDNSTVKLVRPDPNLAVRASVDNSMLMIEQHTQLISHCLNMVILFDVLVHGSVDPQHILAHAPSLPSRQ